MISAGGITLDTAKARVRCDATGLEAHVRPTMARMLALLMERPGRAFTTAQMTDSVYAGATAPATASRVVWVMICRLRRALEDIGADRGLIQTKHTIGAWFDAPGAENTIRVTADEIAAIRTLVAQAPAHARRAAELVRGALARC